VIEMVYRVEGTGDLQLTTRLFGEVIVVSKMDLDKYVYASWSPPIDLITDDEDQGGEHVSR
jgi:hypothetical protein